MSSAPIRPRFECDFEVSPEVVVQRVRALAQGRALSVQAGGDHLSVGIVGEAQHFWSPWLDGHLYEDEATGGCAFRGRFMPRPSLWTAYIFAYAAAGAVACLCAALGAVQLSLGHTLWGFWIVGAAVATLGLLYASAFIGQRLGAEQMHQLAALMAEVAAEKPG